MEAIFAPVDQFLALLADGWELPWVVEPMAGHHGAWSILLTRSAGRKRRRKVSQRST